MRATSGVAPSLSQLPRGDQGEHAADREAHERHDRQRLDAGLLEHGAGSASRSRRVRPSSMRTQECTVEPKKSSFPPSERNESMVHQPMLSDQRLRSRAPPSVSRAATNRRGLATVALRLRGRPPVSPARASAVPLSAGPRSRVRLRAPSRNREPLPGIPRGSCPSAPRRRPQDAALRGGGDASRASVTSPTERSPSRRLQVPDRRTTAASPSRETDTVGGAAVLIRSGRR